MRTYLVQAYLNVEEDADGRWAAAWRGYDPADRIATDEDLLFEVRAETPHGAAERVFVIGNREGEDENGRRWPSDVRSLSVGDALRVSDNDRDDETAWTCQPVGWEERPDGLPNRRVPLAGTNATSRRAFPVHLREGALSWESQVVQYRDAPEPDEEGITYYEGDVSETYPDAPPVDCLLYWRRRIPGGTALHVVGILNHYPVDYPPHERAGNVNVWVRAPQQRQGIATRLWDEAVRRWGVRLEEQRFTASGALLASALDRREGAR